MEVIDAQWIRNRLTNRHGELKALADAAGMTPDKITKILKGERQIKAHEIPAIVAYFTRLEPDGFAEPAQPYRSQVQPVNALGRVHALAAVICPDVKSPVAYRVRDAQMAAGLLAGDILIVELGNTALPGDLVIATLADVDADTQVTVVRRFWPPFVIPLAPDDPIPALQAGVDQTVAIVASVKGMARGGAIA